MTDPFRPALRVRYGEAAARVRPLDRDVFVLGRAPGCDFRLDSPEVAPVHAVLARAADGWRLRDCSGRPATRLNGQWAHDEALADDDVIQIGPFSIDVHLPAWSAAARPAAAAAPAPAEGRLGRSRLNLARLALSLRRRLQAALAARDEADADLARREQEVDRREKELDVLRRELDGRLAELKRAAGEAAEEAAGLRRRREEVEGELARRRAEVAAEREQAAREIDRRRMELACFARHLQRTRRRLAEGERADGPQPVASGPRWREVRGRVGAAP
jgi:hypothetical protein